MPSIIQNTILSHSIIANTITELHLHHFEHNSASTILNLYPVVSSRWNVVSSTKHLLCHLSLENQLHRTKLCMHVDIGRLIEYLKALSMSDFFSQFLVDSIIPVFLSSIFSIATLLHNASSQIQILRLNIRILFFF